MEICCINKTFHRTYIFHFHRKYNMISLNLFPNINNRLEFIFILNIIYRYIQRLFRFLIKLPTVHTVCNWNYDNLFVICIHKRSTLALKCLFNQVYNRCEPNTKLTITFIATETPLCVYNWKTRSLGRYSTLVQEEKKKITQNKQTQRPYNKSHNT